MFGLTILQLILILIITEIIALDSGGPQTQLISKPVVAGTLIGAILGDMTQGMLSKPALPAAASG